MAFHFYTLAYVANDETITAKLLQLTEQIASPDDTELTADHDTFQQRVMRGTHYGHWRSGYLPLTVELRPDTLPALHESIKLQLDPIFSPALRDPNANLPQDLRHALETTYDDYEGRHGVKTAEPGQPDLSRQGKYIAIALYTRPVMHGSYVTEPWSSLDPAEFHAQREALFTSILTILDTLQPHYAFITNNDDFELWHAGTIEKFPPLEPWRYLWSVMVYGPELAQRVGREHLERTPAERVITTPGGLLVVQTADYVFHEREKPYGYPERETRIHAVAQHLNLELPYDTFI